MGGAEAFAVVMVSVAAIPLLAIYMHYRSQGITLFGRVRAQNRDIEGLERDVRALGEQMAAVREGVENLRELLADVVIETHAIRPVTREDPRAINAGDGGPPDTTS